MVYLPTSPALFIPLSYKYGLIHCLLFRCFSLVSDFSKFHTQVEFLKGVLSRNGYPRNIIYSCIKRFLEKLHLKPPLVCDTVPKKELFLVLPYLGKVSLQTRTRLIKLFRNKLPSCQLKVVFKSSLTLGSLLSYKDQIPKVLQSGVVYKSSCNSCNAIYIGKTIRHLKVRASEHLGISHLTSIHAYSYWRSYPQLRSCS